MFEKLLKDIKDFPAQGPCKHKYIFEDDTVGYVDDKTGAKNFKLVIGYKTAFALLNSYGNSVARRDPRFGFKVNCGEILYSQCPSFFQVILGLSGTLPSAHFDELLQPYKFEYKSELPST